MSTANEIFCPKCGAPAERADRFWGYGKPYCSACMWNAELVRAGERRNLKQFPLIVLFVGLVLGTIGYSSAAYPKSFVFLVVAVVAYILFRSWRRLRTLESAQPDATSPHNPPSRVIQTQAEQAEMTRNQIICDRIRALSKPRRTKLNTPSRVISPAIVLVAIYSLMTLARLTDSKTGATNTFTGTHSILVYGLIVSVIGAFAIRTILRHRRLLQNGDVAVALITKQAERGRFKDSYICYEFEDQAGNVVKGECKDGTRKLCEDMRTVVVYNPEAPSENVILANATVILRDI